MNFLCFLGLRGAENYTLRMMAGLELPTSGQVLINGEDVSFKRARDRDIAFVLPDVRLIPSFKC